MTEHEGNKYLMAPVDIYKLINRCFRKESKCGGGSGEGQAGCRGQSKRRKD